MHIIILSLVTCFIIGVSGQANLPDCAKSCVTLQSSGCSNLDIACICKSSDLLQSINCCSADACDATDQASTIAFVKSLCETSGVTGLALGAGCSTNKVTSVTSTPHTQTTSAVVVIEPSSADTATTTQTSDTPIADSLSFASSSAVETPSTSSVSSTSSTSSQTTKGITQSSSSTITSTTNTSATPIASAAASTPPTTTPSPPAKGLSTGAKAGIAIGVILAVVVIALAAFFLLRRRRQSKKNAPVDDLPSQPELPTQANTHEIEGRGKSPIPELWHKQPNLEDVAILPYELPSPPEKHEMGEESAVQRRALPTSANKHEMGALTNITELPNATPSQPQEKQTYSQPFPYLAGPDDDFHVSDTNPVDNQAISPPAPSIASHDWGSTMVTDSASGSAILRMDALQAKMNKIRAEKQRLAKLQELEEAEAEVQREIMEERRRQMEGG